MGRLFSKKEAVKFGWQKTKANLFFWVGLFLAIIVIEGILTSVTAAAGQKNFLPAVFGNLINFAAAMVIGFGLIKVSLKIARGEKYEAKDLLPDSSEKFLNFILGTVVYMVIVLVGFFLLIIPGIIWGIKYRFYSYLIVDKNMKPMEAIKRSGEITKGAKWDIFLLSLILVLITFAGLLVFFVGLFLAVPIAVMAQS